MKTLILSFLAAVLVAGGTARAQNPAPSAPPGPPPQPEMAVIVVDSLRQGHQAFNDFNLISEEFGNVFEARHWPVKVTFEQFAANNRPRPIELKVFYQGIYREFVERKFRAWVTLEVNGTKHDFGIVTFRYLPRPYENVDDMVRAIFRGAAEEIANRIQPFLAPGTAAAAPAQPR